MTNELSERKEHELAYFLRLANDCCNETLNELKGPLNFLADIDSLFMDFIQDAGAIRPPTAGILLLNAHASLRAAIGLAFAGQLLPVFMALRGSIESALYANAMVSNPALQTVWLNRDKDVKARQECREEFKVGKMFHYLSEANDQDFASHLRDSYDSTIDFGAHPNNRLLIRSVRIEALDKDRHLLDFTYIHGVGSFELRQSLVACAEIGLAVFFVALICLRTHPRLEPLNLRSLELQERLPTFIEELGLSQNIERA